LSSFQNRLNIDRTNVMGHSFGGAAALTAAYRRPDLYNAIIAHDPYIGWMPDDARISLLTADRLECIGHNYTDGEEGFMDAYRDNSTTAVLDDDDQCEVESIYDRNMFILNSEEWREKNEGLMRVVVWIFNAGN
jgi:pimeloyl-ACP methyl ester carboxylesterase